MSFKFNKIGSRSYRSWKKWSEGDYLIGKFKKQYEDQFGNPGYEVAVIETDFAEEGDNLNEGDILGLNSCGGLNYKMEEVPENAVIKVEYMGTDVMEKGPMKGKEFHKVELSVDETTVEQVSRVEASVEAEDENLDL